MPGVSKVETTLVRSLVGSVLQTYDSLTGFEFVFAKVTDVLLRFFGADARGTELTSLRLTISYYFTAKAFPDNNIQLYLSAQRLQANHHRVQILTFPQVHRLESFLGRYANRYGHSQKVIDVFHTFKSHLARVHFLHGSRNKSVHQSTGNWILQRLLFV